MVDLSAHWNLLLCIALTFSNSKRWNRSTWIACTICKVKKINLINWIRYFAWKDIQEIHLLIKVILSVGYFYYFLIPSTRNFSSSAMVLKIIYFFLFACALISSWLSEHDISMFRVCYSSHTIFICIHLYIWVWSPCGWFIVETFFCSFHIYFSYFFVH